MYTQTQKIIINGSMTGTAAINSDPIDLKQALGCSIQSVWTGTPTGTLKIQTSDDGDAAVTWTDYTGSSQSTAGAAGDFRYGISAEFARWVRLVYTNASSTGTLNVTASIKKVD